jgi:hypothetical protein
MNSEINMLEQQLQDEQESSDQKSNRNINFMYPQELNCHKVGVNFTV